MGAECPLLAGRKAVHVHSEAVHVHVHDNAEDFSVRGKNTDACGHLLVETPAANVSAFMASDRIRHVNMRVRAKRWAISSGRKVQENARR